MVLDVKAQVIKSQRDSANKSLSKLRAKMKKLRNTHRTEFGPAIAYFEAFGYDDEATKLRDAQAYSDDFIKGQELAFDKLSEQFEKNLKLEYKKRYPCTPNTGWAGPVSALLNAVDAVEVLSKSYFVQNTSVREGVLHHLEQLLEIANSYKPWCDLGDLEEADYSFASSEKYMRERISELGPVSALEVWRDQKKDFRQPQGLKL